MVHGAAPADMVLMAAIAMVAVWPAATETAVSICVSSSPQWWVPRAPVLHPPPPPIILPVVTMGKPGFLCKVNGTYLSVFSSSSGS